MKVPDGISTSNGLPSTIDENKRTVELVFTTGSKGLRNSFDGSYYEELSLDPKHVDITRLNSGAPLLASHDSQNLDSVIGVVDRAWLENGQGKAVVRFSSDPGADKIYQKVKEGVLRNVSIGYTVRKYESVGKKDDRIPTFRAVDYSIHEISIVPIGFDKMAQVRNHNNNQTNEVEIVSTQKENMNDNSSDNQKLNPTLEERSRIKNIKRAVKSAGLDDNFAEELIDSGVELDKARAMVLEKLASTSSRAGYLDLEIGEEHSEKVRTSVEDSLLHRIDPTNFKVTERSKPYYGRSILEVVSTFVPRRNMESNFTFAKRAMSSSDLPLILANVAEKGLQMQYAVQPKSFQRFTKSATLRNYIEFSQVSLSNFGTLQERPEGAEFKKSSLSEANEVVQMKDYGIIHSFTSQMLVNDDLSSLSRLSAGAGIAAARLENKLAYSALTTNKTMKDSVALYHASHGNLAASGAAISETTLNEACKSMMKQTSVSGRDVLNLLPKFLVCGPDQMIAAKKILAEIQANQSSNVNPFSGSMELVVDAELTGNQYYFVADPMLVDGIVCYRLENQEQPKIDYQMNFNTNNLDLKVDHAFAAAPMDWRGIYKNPGQ